MPQIYIISDPDAPMPAPGESALVTVHCEVADSYEEATQAVAVKRQATEGGTFIVGTGMKVVTVPAPTFEGITVQDISVP